ncbi:MAG: AI-2E family transporter [Gammaproteobacteria bacterium RIFCSPLOWO2_02_FULL_42_14]|nr:MAG: AI-2E family transporter [Gammaproteobacteria bacterium RIFCSPHIGHO2_02_FULL_42_43]OGT27421.1 MAG: AI-2E family transporter [Gammaproteobacteria bacterium RIFCSPHIGHO2_01_FULL_42_8]OGT52370.1 MAG: AI-2E family transporter [Gammaproteobacteria bacterium RIFCSPHIGHO2_12_FULL_41_25]OGT63339.1 MAG: AI-2E family transporter [Gammaproteobacteria bacterium RIFCSPLOWO2_02_FULL_42_14]OGT86307.1 MAG: AI-2E family transporter [Gammaproteobacteria bacterium RIFCSPLOWO2_12_FULL_42_18]
MSTSNPLLLSIAAWFRRNFSDPAAVGLFFTVVFIFLFLEFFGNFFLPVIISIVLAYLLLSVVRILDHWHVPHFLSVLLVFLVFIGLVIFGLVGILPVIVRELQNLAVEFPKAFTQGHQWISDLVERYPAIFSDAHFQQALTFLQNQFSHLGQFLLRHLWGLIPNIVTAVLYFILVPILLFFFLKDSAVIATWFSQYLPKNRSLVTKVWQSVNHKIGCYVRGRVIEMVVVGAVSVGLFAVLDLEYAVLLGSLVGLSVIIPYVGAVAVTIPVVVIALLQWGVSAHFFYLLVAYAVIVVLDANVLVPWLFSEAMDLHPVVIILSVLIFGGIWGFWGIFFAIPLATVMDAVLRAWPDNK